MDDADAGLTPSKAPMWVGIGMLGLIGAGAGAYMALRPRASPPPVGVAGDPLLELGRAVYIDRCIACHGEKGAGDGPTAKTLQGPPVGNLSDAKWKHGDQPAQVAAVILEGVPNTAMPAWKRLLDPDQVRSVVAYCYYLGGRPVPAELRREGDSAAAEEARSAAAEPD